jgi:hypothetical protein
MNIFLARLWHRYGVTMTRMPFPCQQHWNLFGENEDYDLFEADDLRERDIDRFLESRYIH